MNEPTPVLNPLAALSLVELRARVVESAKVMAIAKTHGAAAMAEIQSRMASDATERMAGKEHGEVTFTGPDGFKYKAEKSKTVSWDGGILQSIAADMEWPVVQRLFKIDFGMAETVFKAIPDEELREKIATARSVKYGDLKVTPIFDKEKK